MQTIVSWLLPFVLGAVGRMLGVYFSGDCKAGPGFVCDHWATLCAIAGFILGGFGVGVQKASKARAKAAMRAESIEAPPPPSPPAPRDHALSSMPTATSTPPPREGETTRTAGPWGEGPPPPGWDPSGRR